MMVRVDPLAPTGIEVPGGRPLPASDRRRLVPLLAVTSLVALVGCGGGDGSSGGPGTTPGAASTTAAPPGTGDVPPATSAAPAAPAGAVRAPELREELLAMLEMDQAVRTGVAPPGDPRTPDELFAAMGSVDRANTERLREILDEHGWPGWSLVGRDGSTAAWAIVQHADLDLAFQERGLALLREAVEAGDASPGDLAYLDDRVRRRDRSAAAVRHAVGRGRAGRVGATDTDRGRGGRRRATRRCRPRHHRGVPRGAPGDGRSGGVTPRLSAAAATPS